MLTLLITPPASALLSEITTTRRPLPVSMDGKANTCQPVTRNLHRRRLRSAERGDLIVPPTKTVRYA